MESRMNRFWKYENAYITLLPVDQAEPRLGGKVKVQTLIFDWRTFTPSYKTLYGVYSDDFITFGEYHKDLGNPLENEEALLKICEDNSGDATPIKNTFRFQDNKLIYERLVNGDARDLEVEHAVSEVVLEPMIDQTWTEVLFYGLGN